MRRELLQDYFNKSGFTSMQSDTLAAILMQFRKEVATKDDLAMVRSEMESKLDSSLAHLKADLTWRFLGLLALFSTIMTLLNFFVA